MMKKIFFVPFIALFFVAGVVNAGGDRLPSAGITPDSSFYFLDRLGENIREFFTFNPEAKAKLQIEFAGERISEISVMVKNDKISVNRTKGIERAKALLLGNIAEAAEIIKKEKTGGKDVTKLAKEIDNSFNAQEKLLVKTFQDARKKLKKDRIALKRKLTGVDNASLDAQMKVLDTQIGDLKGAQDSIRGLFDNEQDKIKVELDDKAKEEDKLNTEKADKEYEAEDKKIEEIDTEDEHDEIDNEDKKDNEDNNEIDKNKSESESENSKNNREGASNERKNNGDKENSASNGDRDN